MPHESVKAQIEKLIASYQADQGDEADATLLREMELLARRDRQARGEYNDLVELATRHYAKDNLNVDGDADISVGDDGTWVQAWVFLPKRLLPQDPPETEEPPAAPTFLARVRELSYTMRAGMQTRTGVEVTGWPTSLHGDPRFDIRLPDDGIKGRRVTLKPCNRFAEDCAEWGFDPDESPIDSRPDVQSAHDVLDACLASACASDYFRGQIKEVAYGVDTGSDENAVYFKLAGEPDGYVELVVSEPE